MSSKADAKNAKSMKTLGVTTEMLEKGKAMKKLGISDVDIAKAEDCTFFDLFII